MIYYSTVYPPLLPLTIPAFELGKPEDTWRLYLDPSIGNKIDDFKSGFIQIRNGETGRNALYPGANGYENTYLPFRNPFAESIDLEVPEASILQPKGYNETMPFIQRDSNDSYFIDLKHEVFTLSGSHVDIRYKLQVMFSNDWLTSTEDNGRGFIQVYDEDRSSYQSIDMENYFGGNLVQKGISEWSSPTLVSPVSFADYFLNLDKNVIYSSIFEFVGSYRQAASQQTFFNPNYLDSYKIDIYRAFGEEKELLIDTSGWIEGQRNANLEIRWQNRVELENKKKYIVTLTIQTIWDLRKEITYVVDTSFEASLFRGNIEVENDHYNARAKIKMDVQTPLTWGPKENLSITEGKVDYAHIDGEATVEQGIDFYSKDGAFAGEMLVSGIKPISDWKAKENEWFFKLTGPELTIHNPVQEEYYMYAHSVPISETSKENEEIPYEDDIVINPVIESGSGEAFQTYLDTNGKTDTGMVVTMSTSKPASYSFFYIEDDIGNKWEVTVSEQGEFVTRFSHEADMTEYIKPVFFYDRNTRVITKPKIQSETGIIYLEDFHKDYVLGNNAAPQYVNEFRLVKKVHALQLGRKTEILSQTYKSYMTDFNRKLNGWQKIDSNNEYYIYFASIGGQIRMIVRDITASEMGIGRIMDRFTSTYTNGVGNLPSSQIFLITDGIDANYVPKEYGSDRPFSYAISIDERGALVANQSFIGTSSSTVKSITKEEI